MSCKQPLFQEKILPHREIVPETTAKPGETTAEERKCPGNNSNSRRNFSRKGEMSWKAPQNREKTQTQEKNYFPERTSTAFKISLSS